MKFTDEPCSLKRCQPARADLPGAFYACARPGRSLGSTAAVPDNIVEMWAEGLPQASTIHLVSLLGTKEDGQSEYTFYTFRGGLEPSTNRPTFQEWLDSRYGQGHFRVSDYPTVDAGSESLSAEDIEAVNAIVLPLLRSGETVVLFDSGGSQRTGQYCRVAGFRRVAVKTPIVDVK